MRPRSKSGSPPSPRSSPISAASKAICWCSARAARWAPACRRLARRALDAAGRDDVTVYAVSRWSDKSAADELEAAGVSTVAFDLMDPAADLAGLPDAGNVVFMVGAKFGSAGAPSHAWAVNAAMPDRVARRWSGARIAAFSTGNVYPLVPVSSGGCTESDPVGPVGEYAMSCLGRERIFGHAALTRGTKVANIRLNYAVDLRYGVLADIAYRVQAGEPVDVTTGHANVVWQGYANEVALRSLLHATDGEAFTINLTGPETASVRRIARWFGEKFGKEPVFMQRGGAHRAALRREPLPRAVRLSGRRAAHPRRVAGRLAAPRAAAVRQAHQVPGP